MAVGPAVIVRLIFQLLIGSLIGAVILRAACALWNKWFGGSVASSVEPNRPSRDMPQAEDGNPYRAPSIASHTTSLIPPYVEIPIFSKAFGIILASTFAAWVLAFAFGYTLGRLGGANQRIMIVAMVGGGLMGFLVQAFFTNLMLPTTFKRGLVITLLFTGIALLVALAIFVVVFIVMTALGGLR